MREVSICACAEPIPVYYDLGNLGIVWDYSTATPTQVVFDNSVGALADGVFRKTSPFYKNPGYPAYNPTAAKALINAYNSLLARRGFPSS